MEKTKFSFIQLLFKLLLLILAVGVVVVIEGGDRVHLVEALHGHLR